MLHQVHLIFTKRVVPGCKLNPLNWFKSFREATFENVRYFDIEAGMVNVIFKGSDSVYRYPVHQIARMRTKPMADNA